MNRLKLHMRGDLFLEQHKCRQKRLFYRIEDIMSKVNYQNNEEGD